MDFSHLDIYNRNDDSGKKGKFQMAELHSVTGWFDKLQAGNSNAAQKLWERYYPRLVKLARVRLAQSPQVAHDAEDIALSAFASFCHHAENGQFPNLSDRDDLWRLLVTITTRKALRAIRSESRAKRGGDNSRHDMELHQLIGDEPTPSFAAQVSEELRRLLGRLENPDLSNIAVWKMEGFSTLEIAGRLGVVHRTVHRKLQLIRQIWENTDAS